MKYIKEKSRVIVYDCDIDVQEDKWRIVMRHVLGRHYQSIKGSGPAWTFPARSLEEFEKMISPPSTSTTISTQTTDDDNTTTTTIDMSTQTKDDDTTTTTMDVSTQTDEPPLVVVCCASTQTDKHTNKQKQPAAYKYDIDPYLHEFCRQWLLR